MKRRTASYKRKRRAKKEGNSAAAGNSEEVQIYSFSGKSVKTTKQVVRKTSKTVRKRQQSTQHAARIRES